MASRSGPLAASRMNSATPASIGFSSPLTPNRPSGTARGSAIIGGGGSQARWKAPARFLVVEDKEHILEFVQRTLEEFDYTVMVAPDGTKGIQVRGYVTGVLLRVLTSD